VRFSWDESKNRANLRKHGISFEAARLAFADPFVIFEQDRESDDEVRWQAIGKVSGQTLLLVAHTYEDDEGEEAIRIISARHAATRESEIYNRQFYPGSNRR
jgi:uncharacterized DUF497 family protein